MLSIIQIMWTVRMKEIARHYDRVKTIDGILTNTKTCPEETLLQLGNIDGTVTVKSREIGSKS